MTDLARVFLIVTVALAVGDWVAVGFGRKSLEYFLKPLTMLALVAFAITLEPENSTQRALFVAALGFGLLGDVFLMLPADRFLLGLGAFLVGHLFYIAGFRAGGASLNYTVIVWLLLLVGTFPLVRLVARGATMKGLGALQTPVTFYASVLCLMAASAIASGKALAAGGAALFLLSDGLIGIERFVRSRPWMRPVIMITYHLAQIGLVVSLVAFR